MWATFMYGADGFSAVPPAPTAQSSSDTNPVANRSDLSFRLRAESNLVVVRVVVRDSRGRPIEGLHKENFTLFDNGKEQTISQFSIENASSSGAGTAPSPATPAGNQPISTTASPRILVFYFDDLNMELSDINYARDAAYHYLETKLNPSDRVGVYSSSGAIHANLTSDLTLLHDALFKLMPIMPVSSQMDCPHLSDYQAEQIFDHEDNDAIGLALEEAEHRNCSLPPGETGKTIVKQVARDVASQYRQRSQRSLDGLNGLVTGIAHLPGQKEIIFTSAGFLSQDLQEQIDGIINRALQAQVMISSLDPKGVALLMPEADVTTNYIPTRGDLSALMHSYAGAREFAATSVLSQMAEGTGGDFFHSNNDLNAGFLRLAGQPVFYTLAFSPSNLDGKFHKLQVKLTQTQGTVQARHGYMAVKMEHNEQAEQKEMLRELMASREEVHQFPMSLRTEIGASTGDTKDFALFVKLGVAGMHFRKEDGMNLNTLIFLTGIYDSNGKWVTGEQKRYQLKLADAQLQDVQTKGVGLKNTYKLKPGKYLVREIVQDSEDQHLAAQNQEIEIP